MVKKILKKQMFFFFFITKCTNDVCGMRCVGRRRRKCSEYWNKEVGGVVAKKRREFEEWLQRRDRVTYTRYL